MGNPREDNILSDCNHLYAEDLGGKEATLTIKAIEKEEVRGGGSGRADKRYTFHFQETPKAWVPGVKCRRAIAAALGTNNRTQMIGAKLTLYPTSCEAFGERNVPCLRVRRATMPTGQQPAQATAAPAELQPADDQP